MGATGTLEIHDTTIFNNILEALDTGKIVYIFGNGGSDGYDVITGFIIINSDESLSIELYTIGSSFVIYPSEGYNASNLYIPTNLTISETDFR